MDGKHIIIRQPKNSGSYFFNYKSTFSIVLLALVDADYKFIYVDVGCNGRISDGGVFRNSTLSKAIYENLLNIPPPRKVGEEELLLPYVILADDAFPLNENIMKPFPYRGLSLELLIFNYRASRGRRISENVFGILANRFRVFLSPMLLSSENVEIVSLESCVLHNFLRIKIPSEYTPPGTFDSENTENGSIQVGEWRSQVNEGMRSIVPSQTGHNYKRDAKLIRDDFCTYFNGSGAVSWQEKFI